MQQITGTGCPVRIGAESENLACADQPGRKRVCAVTLGCKVNQYDTDSMLGALSGAGFTIVGWGEPADVAIVNTCTVTAVADSKSRAQIRRAARAGIPVCVCGCLASHEAEQLLAMEGVAAAVPLSDRGRIVEIISEIAGVSLCAGVEGGRAVRPRTRTRGFLKIQEGCSSSCTYCIIPEVRGRPRTRPAADILADASRMAGDGVQELVLSGTHISSYGSDNGETLVDLLHELSAIPGVCRLRLGSIEPWLLSRDTIEQLANVEKLCPHFHVSLQSGCAATLKRMKRRYTPDQYMNRVSTLRAVFEEPAITTDIMTGFPGETEAEFAESAEFVKNLCFAKLHVFPYSEREGTPAAYMPGSVPVDVRRERAAEMIRIGNESQRQYAKQFTGNAEAVLLDRRDREGSSGYTDRYVRVYVKGAEPGGIVTAVLNKLHGTEFIGTLQT